MNRQLTAQELDALLAPIPRTPPPMTRREKLLRFAELIRTSRRRGFYIFHALEYYNAAQLAQAVHRDSAFALAASDDVFNKAGLRGESALDAMRFFELDQGELHEFSCDCGGALDNAEMARRVEKLAARK